MNKPISAYFRYSWLLINNIETSKEFKVNKTEAGKTLFGREFVMSGFKDVKLTQLKSLLFHM